MTEMVLAEVSEGWVLAAMLGIAAGAAAGLGHFGSLWWNTRLYASGGSALAALLLQIARFAVLLAVFAVLARVGAVPLLAGALGLLLARSVLIRRLGGLS